MKFTEFATDPKKELEGTEVPIGSKSFVTVARFGNPRFRELLDKLIAPFKRGGRGGAKITPEEDHEIMVEVVANTILLGWRGFQNEDGSEAVYSVDAAREQLGRYREFFDAVVAEAQKFDNYALSEQEALAQALGKE